MSEKLKTLNDLFEHEIKDLYSAEKQIIAALPKMVETATARELKEAFRDHLEETKKQKERLEKVGEICGFDVNGETCKAMEGLVKEGEDMINMEAENDVRDAGLIATSQRIEHYEIAGYGAACQYAEQLGHNEALEHLKKSIDEEKNTDNKLTRLAKSKINEEAIEAEE